MKKPTSAAALGLALGLTGMGANATLVNGSTLDIGAGSFFEMEVSPGFFLRTAITGHAGIVLGTSQPTGTSHVGLPTGTEAIATSIDEPWGFFGNTGLDFTVSPTNVLSASGNTATVDFSGWRVTWNGIPSINMGGGAWDGNVNGVANVTCSGSCALGILDCYPEFGCVNETYTLTYTATVPAGDPSNLGGVRYRLVLTNAVPLPAAVWLLGSGLVGLIGVARCKLVI